MPVHDLLLLKMLEALCLDPSFSQETHATLVNLWHEANPDIPAPQPTPPDTSTHVGGV